MSKHDTMIDHYLNVGLAGFTGIAHSMVEILYETLSEKALDPSQFKAYQKELLSKAYQLGKDFSNFTDFSCPDHTGF